MAMGKAWLRVIVWLIVCCSAGAHADECPAWSVTRARTEMLALHDRLDGWNRAYRAGDQSPVDDAVYDQSLQRLLQWRQCFPAQAPAVPAPLADATGSVRAPVARLPWRRGCRRRETMISGCSPRPMAWR
jgi:DNA ligase (NAD+)